MSKILVIAEKPSVARELAKILKCKEKKNGFISGENYLVTWAIGHLVTLYEPGDYHPKYKNWDFSQLPIIPEKIKLKPNQKTISQFEIIKLLINSDQISELICATDSGREGELIFRYLYYAVKCKKPFKRLWISSMTEKSIKNGFAKLKPGSEYDNLYYSAKSRSEADWLVGINASRAFTIQYDALLSIGRVQSPTLALIVKKQEEIDSFDSRPFWEINITTISLNALWIDSNTKDSKIFLEEDYKKITAKIKNQIATVINIEKEDKYLLPPFLYDLTELQRDANKKYGFTAKKTLSLAQDLYEKHKIITYPRTDSRFLSDDIIPILEPILKKLFIEPFKSYTEYVLSLEKLPISKRIVDNSKVSDHHAIIPTETNFNLKKLNMEEKQLFYMIVKRFLAVFYPKYEFSTTKIYLNCCDELFVAKGKVVNNLGWMQFYTSEEVKQKNDKEQALPNMNIDDKEQIIKVITAKKKTTPPKPYTEATLLSAMEHAGRFVENEELKEQLKDSGLGTPATRASIIERLIQVNYIMRSKKSLLPTEKGKKLIKIIPPALKSPEFTGEWERGLSQIAKGDASPESFMNDIKKYIIEITDFAKNKNRDIVFKPKNNKKINSLGDCLLCSDGKILENKKAYYCTNWRNNCKFNIWKNQFEIQKIKYDNKLIEELLKNKEIPNIEAEIKGEKKIVTLKLMDNGRIRFIE